MKLYELVQDVCLQGDIRISAWDESGEEETVLRTFDAVEYVLGNQIPKGWEDADVLYMFCPGDGFLHIEVERKP